MYLVDATSFPVSIGPHIIDSLRRAKSVVVLVNKMLVWQTGVMAELY